MNHNDLIKQVIPLLYNYPAGIPKSQWQSSYACKHDVEHLVGTYITNDEFKQAGAEFGLDYHTRRLPNYCFAVKPRFPMEWLRELNALTERPRGARNSQWTAYLDARREVETLKSNIQDAEDHQQEVLAAYNFQNPHSPVSLSQ